MTVFFPSNLYLAFACVYFFLDLVDVGFKENAAGNQKSSDAVVPNQQSKAQLYASHLCEDMQMILSRTRAAVYK